jgi:hypothetical protein
MRSRRRIDTVRRFGGNLFLALTVALVLFAGDAATQDADEADAVSNEARARMSRLQGRAFVDRNKDVIGATVVVRPHDDPSKVFLTSTGDRGGFRVDGLPDGEYNIRLEREGFATLSKEQVSLRFPFRAVVEVKMDEANPSGLPQAQPAVHQSGAEDLSVQGRVLELGEGPLGEIYMRFIRSDGQQDPRYLRSAEDGGFETNGLMQGRWRLFIQGVGYLPLRTEVELDGDTELFVYLVQQPADYEPSPMELMLPEQPLPPRGLGPLSNNPR